MYNLLLEYNLINSYIPINICLNINEGYNRGYNLH